MNQKVAKAVLIRTLKIIEKLPGIYGNIKAYCIKQCRESKPQACESCPVNDFLKKLEAKK